MSGDAGDTVTRLPDLNEEEITFIKKGLWFSAIKSYSTRNKDIGLSASKFVVEGWGEANGYRIEGVCHTCNGTGRAVGWKR